MNKMHKVEVVAVADDEVRIRVEMTQGQAEFLDSFFKQLAKTDDRSGKYTPKLVLIDHTVEQQKRREEDAKRREEDAKRWKAEANRRMVQAKLEAKKRKEELRDYGPFARAYREALARKA